MTIYTRAEQCLETTEALTRPQAFVSKPIQIPIPLLMTAGDASHSVVEILVKIGCLKTSYLGHHVPGERSNLE